MQVQKIPELEAAQSTVDGMKVLLVVSVVRHSRSDSKH